MTCGAAESLLEDALDRPLNSGEFERLHAHLADCPNCARLARDLRQIAAGLARLDGPPLPDATWRAMVERASAETRPSYRRGAGRAVVLLPLSAAVAVACWVGWRALRLGREPSSRPFVVPPVVARAHETPVPEPTPKARNPQAGAATERAPDRWAPRTAPRRAAHRRRPAAPKVGLPPNRPAFEVAEAPPALSAQDVTLIYETALGLAREGGQLGAPLETVAAARQQVVLGDLAGAIASYEAAVEASVRPPVRLSDQLPAATEEDIGLWSPPGVLLAWASSPEVMAQ